MGTYPVVGADRHRMAGGVMGAYDNDPRVTVENYDGSSVTVTNHGATWGLVLSDRRHVWDVYMDGELVPAASGIATMDDAIRALIGDPR